MILSLTVHTSHHPDLVKLSREGIISEVYSDRRNLEEIAGYPVEAVGDYQQSVLTRRDGTQEALISTSTSQRGFPLSAAAEAWMRWRALPVRSRS